MKNQNANYLIMICFVLLSFLFGYYMGRNFHHTPIQFSQPLPFNPVLQESVHISPTQAITPVNINTATQEQLMTLPGVGETLASRIVAYRKENGSFAKVTDLMNVEGFGAKRLEALLDFITVGG